MRVLLLPGFGASNRNFQPYFDNFENFGVVDFHACTTLDDHITQIRNQITQKADKVDIIGVSWGGLLGLIFAFRYPELVDKMIIAGTDRKLRMPKSLSLIMNLPFVIFCLVILGYVLVYPLVRLIDPKGYRQKYGGIGVLQRFGWKRTHKVYNSTLLKTRFEGSIIHPTLLLNLETDYLVSNEELMDLSENGSNKKVMIKYVEPINNTQIHMSHELDDLIIREAKLTFPLL